MSLAASPLRALRALLATTALAAVPALLVAQAPARQVAGTYAFEVLSPNGAVKVQMVLKQEGAAHAGTLNADGFPALQLSRVTPTDSGVIVEADTPDGSDVSVIAKIAADNRLMGKVNYAGMEMPFTGTFTPAGGAAAATTAPATVDPVGAYAGATTEPFMGQGSFPFECVIERGANGTLKGGCGQPGNGPGEAPFEKVEVSGATVKANGQTPAGPYALELTIAGTEATGAIVLGGERAKLKATFTPVKK